MIVAVAITQLNRAIKETKTREVKKADDLEYQYVPPAD